MTPKILLLMLLALTTAEKFTSLKSASGKLGPSQYSFDWAVNDRDSGNDFEQQETRDGYDTRGSYSVRLPDGRLQTVTYYVDGDSGFVAEISYEGEAVYN